MNFEDNRTRMAMDIRRFIHREGTPVTPVTPDTTPDTTPENTPPEVTPGTPDTTPETTPCNTPLTSQNTPITPETSPESNLALESCEEFEDSDEMDIEMEMGKATPPIILRDDYMDTPPIILREDMDIDEGEKGVRETPPLHVHFLPLFPYFSPF